MKATVWRRLAPLFFLLVVGAGPAASTEIEPPPPPPAPSPPGQPPPAPEKPSEGDRTVDRYQLCLQKMIDAGVSDNAYMRRCLGLSDRPVGRRGSETEALGKADVQQVVERNLPALRECYGQLLSRSAGIGMTPEGEVAPRFEVLPDGSVDDLTFDATSLADVSLIACFRDRLRAWAFPRTSGTAKLGVRLSFRLSRPKGAKTGVVAVTKGFPKLVGGAAGLSPEEVNGVFRKGVPAARSCFEDLQKRRAGQPQVGGAATADLGIGTDGHVTKVAFTELAPDDEVFRNCLTLQLKRWRFPRPHGGEPVTVRSPRLVFAPPGPATPGAPGAPGPRP